MKTIKEGHPCWRVEGELDVWDRATLEIGNECPEHIAKAVMTAWHHGYIELGVNFSERELALLGLTAKC